jgi:hypothetical protein
MWKEFAENKVTGRLAILASEGEYEVRVASKDNS